jgi:tetratricopeptide (TPR) repeat protein
MDRDTFDYTYGDAVGPDPAQRDLDDLLPQVTRVCVLSGALYRGHSTGGDVLLETDDPGALRELADCLRVVEDPGAFGHCPCLGGPTLELYAGAELLAVLGLHHGRAVRWQRWHHDARLQDGGRLDAWLTGHGIEAGLLQAIYQRGDSFLPGPGEPAPGRPPESRRRAVRAQSLAAAGRYAEALGYCNRALELDADAEAYGLRGLVYYHLHRFEESAADCCEAIHRGLRKPDVYFARGVAYDLAGRAAEAHADLSMTIHLEPAHARAYNSRALARARLGRAEEALADVAEAIRHAPHWFLPYWHRATLRQQQGELDGVVADCSEVIRMLEQAWAAGDEAGPGPNLLAAAYVRRGRALEALGQPGPAREDYDRAVSACPDCADALDARARLCLCEGRVHEAMADFKAVVRLAEQGRGWVHLPVLAGGGAETRLAPLGRAGAYAGRATAQLEQKESEAPLADHDGAINLAPDDPAEVRQQASRGRR